MKKRIFVLQTEKNLELAFSCSLLGHRKLSGCPSICQSPILVLAPFSDRLSPQGGKTAATTANEVLGQIISLSSSQSFMGSHWSNWPHWLKPGSLALPLRGAGVSGVPPETHGLRIGSRRSPERICGRVSESWMDAVARNGCLLQPPYLLTKLGTGFREGK